MKRLYLILMILGAVLPLVYFVDFFSSEGLAPRPFMRPLFANGAVAGFTVDVLVSSLIFRIFMIYMRSGDGGLSHSRSYCSTC